MKGLIFIIIVTLVVLASFARPEKEIKSVSITSEVTAKSQSAVLRDTTNVLHKQGL
jgi:hypothetical protein